MRSVGWRGALVAGVIVVALGGWLAVSAARIRHVNEEMRAARPEIDRILQAAETEATLLDSGQLNPRITSPVWQPYAAESHIDLGDASVPLRQRFIELTRRSKARELALTRQLQMHVRASGLRTILEPENLIGAQARANALGEMPRYRAFLDAYLESVRELQRQAEADVRALGLPRASEREIIAGYEHSSDAAVSAVRQFVEREKKALRSATLLVNFIDARADDAELRNGRIVFSNASLQTEYDRMRAALAAAEPSS
ncbi:MAG TPA: hypothetical protein VFS52_13865 [Steroidobacteraceae bacterium]|jgi:hypothetical protein|nr:hypothetical protein [Steroidobacteraceae bacterium]